MRNESSEKCSAKGKTGERYSRPSGDTIPMRRIIILLTVLISMVILGVEFLLLGSITSNLAMENNNPSNATIATTQIDSATTISGTVTSTDETTMDTTPAASTVTETTMDTTPAASTVTEAIEETVAPDKPAEIQIDADMLKSIVYGESTINLLRQYGLELTFEDRLKIAEIYRIKDTEILVALGRAAESPIDESVVVAISAPAHVVIPDKIGSPNDAFIENSIIFVPDGKISGDVGTGLFFGWPEGIPSKTIAKDTIVCFTGTNPPASSYEGLCYFYIKDGFCKQCGVALSEDTTAFEGFGICIDCYYENLGPEDICDNCGADCSFMGKIEGLCMICYDAKYPSSGGSCVNCGASELLLDENGLCEDCVCPLCGGPLTEDHDCNNYPNIVCTNCDWEGFVAGAGADGVTCPICRTQVIEPSDDEPEDSAE